MMNYIKLSELTVSLESGSRPKGGVSSDGIPSIGGEHIKSDGTFKFDNMKYVPEDFFNNLKKGVIDRGDILIVKDGATTGKVAFVDNTFPYKNAAINEHVFKLKINNEMVLPKYVFYYLYSRDGNRQLMKDFRGATVGGITKNFLNLVQIPIPRKLEFQNKIVTLLDKARELINKRKAQIEALDQLTQSVFLEMFGDPATNPKKWPMGFIKDLTLKTQYGTSKKASEDAGKYPILRMNNITYEGHWDLTDLKYVDLDEKEVEKYLVHKGELLFNRTNSKELVGKTAVYRFEKPMAFAGYLVKLIPNEKANAEFISAYLNSKYGKSILLSMAKNIVGMANINAEELKSIKIYIPPKQLQDQFAEIVQKIESQREFFKKGLVELEKNFNSIMQRAFKGELFNN